MRTPILTDEQQAVMSHDPTQHARVLAGPGTGKSFTLVAFLGNLLGRTPTPKVKLLTFTRAATAELGEKVAGQPLADAERPSTVHSFAISVLLQNPGAGTFPEPLRIADGWETKNVVEPTLAKRLGCGLKVLGTRIKQMAAGWELLTDPDLGVSDTEKARFLGAWNEHRRVYGYTLLAELPYALLSALRTHGELKGLGFDILLVDEYQDLNACDLALFRELAKRGCAVVGAGDDDQSIYSFRKADPEGIRRFLKDYPEADDYTLSVTLRCGRNIVKWANFVIQGDPGRPKDKKALTPAPGSRDGEVQLLRFPGQASEAKGIANLVVGLVKHERIEPSDILILLRSDYNRQFSKPIQEHLEAEDIKTTDPSFVNDILDAEENRRVLARLRLLVDPEDSIAWSSLLKLEPGVGPGFFEYVYALALPEQKTFADALRHAQADGFADAPGASRSRALELVQSVSDWLGGRQIPDEMPEDGWRAWLCTLIDEGGLSTGPTSDFLELFGDVAEQLNGDQFLTLGRLLSQLQPVGKDLAQARSEGVRIMGMTGSKGLTVRATIIGALEEGLVPMRRCDLNEERRILYVAMTRAKEYLFGTWAHHRKGPTARAARGNPGIRSPSSFFRDGPVVSQDGERFIKERFQAK